jgi:hypothetical protein
MYNRDVNVKNMATEFHAKIAAGLFKVLKQLSTFKSHASCKTREQQVHQEAVVRPLTAASFNPTQNNP